MGGDYMVLVVVATIAHRSFFALFTNSVNSAPRGFAPSADGVDMRMELSKSDSNHNIEREKRIPSDLRTRLSLLANFWVYIQAQFFLANYQLDVGLSFFTRLELVSGSSPRPLTRAIDRSTNCLTRAYIIH